MGNDTFVCAECEEEFVAIRNDLEAVTEARKLFPSVPMDEMAVVCEDCFKKVMAENEHELPEEEP